MMVGSTKWLTNRGMQPPPFFDLEAFCKNVMVRRSRNSVEKWGEDLIRIRELTEGSWEMLT